MKGLNLNRKLLEKKYGNCLCDCKIGKYFLMFKKKKTKRSNEKMFKRKKINKLDYIYIKHLESHKVKR